MASIPLLYVTKGSVSIGKLYTLMVLVASKANSWTVKTTVFCDNVLAVVRLTAQRIARRYYLNVRLYKGRIKEQTSPPPERYSVSVH